MAFEIIQGEQKVMPISLIRVDSEGNVLGVKNLAGITELSVCFKREGGGADIVKTIGSGVTIVSEPDGTISITLDVADTDVLAPVAAATMELTLTFAAGVVDKIHIPKAYSVKANICT